MFYIQAAVEVKWSQVRVQQLSWLSSWGSSKLSQSCKSDLLQGQVIGEEKKQEWAGWSKIAPMLITTSNTVISNVETIQHCDFIKIDAFFFFFLFCAIKTVHLKYIYILLVVLFLQSTTFSSWVLGAPWVCIITSC